MREAPERTRGTLLRKLDMDKLVGDIREHNKIVPELTIRIGIGDHAFAEVDGTSYLLCSEGVGWDVTDDDIELGVYISSPGTIAIMPAHIVELTTEEIRSYLTDETVDLADFIRTFGGRLEENFWMWRGRLAEKAKVPDA